MATELGYCYKHKLKLPKTKYGVKESEKFDKGVRINYAGRALSKWLTELRKKYKPKKVPNKKVIEDKAVAE